MMRGTYPSACDPSFTQPVLSGSVSSHVQNGRWLPLLSICCEACRRTSRLRPPLSLQLSVVVVTGLLLRVYVVYKEQPGLCQQALTVGTICRNPTSTRILSLYISMYTPRPKDSCSVWRVCTYVARPRTNNLQQVHYSVSACDLKRTTRLHRGSTLSISACHIA